MYFLTGSFIEGQSLQNNGGAFEALPFLPRMVPDHEYDELPSQF